MAGTLIFLAVTLILLVVVFIPYLYNLMTASSIQYWLLPIMKAQYACKVDTKQCTFVLFLLRSYPIPIAMPLLNYIGKPEETSALLHPSTIGQAVFFPSLGRCGHKKHH